MVVKTGPQAQCHDQVFKTNKRFSVTSHLLNAAQRDLLRTVLLQRREVLLADMASRQGEATRVQHAREVLLDDDGDADREVDLALTDQERKEMADIGAALDRLVAGDYGACVDCAEPIAFERLHAQPQALRCVAC